MEILACPHCQRLFHVSVEALGKTIRCRGCRQTFYVPVDVTRVGFMSSATPTSGQASLLPIAIECFVDEKDARCCPACRRTFLMKASFVGKTIRCRSCKMPFQVMATEPSIPSKAVCADIGDVVSDTPSGQHVPEVIRPRHPVAASGAAVGGAAGLIAIILGGVCALPVTQLILWWGFDQDPMKLAGHVPQIMQWLVPPPMRP
jgi:predicted Zn finger-like uncharacterized protein